MIQVTFLSDSNHLKKVEFLWKLGLLIPILLLIFVQIYSDEAFCSRITL